jgi:hypothetical protein
MSNDRNDELGREAVNRPGQGGARIDEPRSARRPRGRQIRPQCALCGAWLPLGPDGKTECSKCGTAWEA